MIDLNTIYEEMLSVAKALDIPIKALTRDKFVKNSFVTKGDLEKYGGYGEIKRSISTYGGYPRHEDLRTKHFLQEKNKYVKKLERSQYLTQYKEDLLIDAMSEVFSKNKIDIPTSYPTLSKKTRTNRVVTLLLSDLHFGVDVDDREVFNSRYNWEVAARRMAHLVSETANWKREHREETELQVVLNGDILHGVIHLSDSNIKNITEQIWGATAILSQALNFLATQFKKVSVLCLPGNHDRVTYRGPERAVSQRWDSHAHSVFMGLKLWFKDAQHVTFDIPMSGIGTYEACGHLIVATHGDTEPSTSNVGSSFNVNKTTQAIQKLQIANVFDKKIDAILFGHWHQPSLFMLSDGTQCVVNGCLIGSDTYAQNGIGIFNNHPAQVMFESVRGYPIGDFRILRIPKHVDSDLSMDKIIKVDTSNLLNF